MKLGIGMRLVIRITRRVHGLNTIDKFVSGGIIFLVFFVPIVSVVLYYVLKKYISWNSKFLLKDGR